MISSLVTTLTEAEETLVTLTAAERTRWQEVARVLMRVEAEELWRDAAPSFTAWVREIAARSSMQPSSFWRALKAGRFVVERAGASDADDVLNDLQVGAQSIELAEKIARYAPDEIAEDIVSRTLAGELTYANLYDTWKSYRPAARGLTARGRLPSDLERREDVLAERQSRLDTNKRRPDVNDALAAGEQLTLLTSSFEWLGPHDQAHCEMAVELEDLRADLVVVVRRDRQHPHELELHAVCVRGSMRHLSAQPFDSALRVGVHRVWLAVPAAHAAKAQEDVPGYVGILRAKNGDVQVARAAKALQPDSTAQAPWRAALLARAYRWPQA